MMAERRVRRLRDKSKERAAHLNSTFNGAMNIACVLATDEHELESGAIKASAPVAESHYRKGTGEGREAVTAAIFSLKTRARCKETSLHEVEGIRNTSAIFVPTYDDMKFL
ncbi:hypothetical protein [Mesorhizobium sp.]|uniref:hypothetical protein n=1 Tax=Mesorhizobium sp. TaxID=1871066 RepID=UPI001219CEAC|nr:hypothetical protein [Mesorhizobium sp.]TIL64684.1 MAG: hypothetical protein E5Y77_25310 [Mesorhizobium sp.]